MRSLLLIPAALVSSFVFAGEPLDIEVYAKAYNTNGYQGYPTTLTTNHQVFVRNNTDKRTDIIVFYTICAENKECDDTHHRQIWINAHATWEGNVNLSMSPTYYRVGNYKLTARTRVQSDNQIKKDISDTGYIYIR